MFKTVVVGVDGRAGGRDALSLAARLAAREDADIVAARVIAREPHAPPYDRTRRAGEARAAVERDVARSGVAAARTHVTTGRSTARALQRVAEREHADLIVLGSSHRGRVGRVVLGDVAGAVLREAPCPVAIAPRTAATTAARTGAETIGVGVGDPDETRRTLRFAAALARSRDARLCAVSVVRLPVALAATPAWEETWAHAYRVATRARLRRALNGIGDVEASAVAVVGDPISHLSALSREVDLLVLGSGAWGAVRRVFGGGTAATLSHEAGCPLLILPHSAVSADLTERTGPDIGPDLRRPADGAPGDGGDAPCPGTHPPRRTRCTAI